MKKSMLVAAVLSSIVSMSGFAGQMTMNQMSGNSLSCDRATDGKTRALSDSAKDKAGVAQQINAATKK